MARRQVSIFINGRQVENTIKGITSEKRKLNRELNRMQIGSEEYNRTMSRVKDLDGVLRKHRQGLRETSSAWDKLKGGLRNFAGIAAGALAVDALVGYGKELFKMGAEMEVLARRAEVVFGEALPKVSAAAEETAKSLGLTSGEFVDQAAAIGDLLIPMGFMRSEAADLSIEMIQLAGALSEANGGKISTAQASDILTKALLGERDSLTSLGLSIRDADIKARLAEKGLRGLTGQTLKQAEAAATLELITEQSADAQRLFGENADSLTRKQRELQVQFREIQQRLAEVLIPVFHRLTDAVLPVVERITEWILSLGQAKEANAQLTGIMKAVGVVVRNVSKIFSSQLEVVRKVSLFLLDRFGPAIQFVVVKMGELYNVAARARNWMGELLGMEGNLEIIDIEELETSLEKARQMIAKYRTEQQPPGGGSALRDDAFQNREPGSNRPQSPGPAGGGRRSGGTAPGVGGSSEMRQLAELEELTNDLAATYDGMTEMARLNGLELRDIQLETELQRTDIVRKAVEERNQLREEEEKAAIEALKANAQAMQQRFSTAGQVISDVLDLVGDKSAAAAQFSRLLTIAQLGIDSARAISAAVAASAGVPFPGNLAAIATSVTTVIGNIAAAKKLLGEATVPQRAGGGWFWVTGQDDGRRYNARHIGRPGTGLLQHGHPVLIDSSGGSVLANERGPEYFVANHDLRNPKVLSYVRAIDNLTRTRQYQEGGFTAPPPTGASEPDDGALNGMQAIMGQLTRLVARQTDVLERGVVARIDDDTIIDLRRRTSDLLEASGGALD